MQKSKVILRLKKPRDFSLSERKFIIEEWQSSGRTKKEIWNKYTGQEFEKGYLLKWMRQLGYEIPSKWSKLDKNQTPIMSKKTTGSSIETFQLQAKVKQLEKALVNSELRATAMETMIEVAEKEFKISIKKKSYTKPSIK